ncbi:hypothetical protein L7F22_040901 [Adiantum nelumboides]|nr:hypothetical protein [Adiantum nelumboides]
MAAYVELSKNDCPKSDAKKAKIKKIPYLLVVGSLMYAMVSTRPDIAFAVGVVSKYMANLGKKHWEVVKHVLRCLKGLAGKCLCFGNSDASIVGYIDLDYAESVNTRRSASCYVFLFARATVSWRSCLQNCSGRPWYTSNPVLHCDSQSAIALAKNHVFHSKSKHIEVRYHGIRDISASKHIELAKVDTNDNPVDALTKSLSSERFAHCIEMMGVG